MMLRCEVRAALSPKPLTTLAKRSSATRCALGTTVAIASASAQMDKCEGLACGCDDSAHLVGERVALCFAREVRPQRVPTSLGTTRMYSIAVAAKPAQAANAYAVCEPNSCQIMPSNKPAGIEAMPTSA